MQNNKGKAVDVVNEVLEDCLMAFPVSPILISLYQQYRKRGFLTRKQLQALHIKAVQAPDISPGKIATLEALIRKLPERFKSVKPEATPLYQKDEASEQMIRSILEKYPGHKRALFLRSKLDNHEQLTGAEITDLKRLTKLLR